MDELSALVLALASCDPAAQAQAAEKLAQMGEEARSAAVELVDACQGLPEVREWANAALEGLGPPAAAAVKPLVTRLTSESLDVAYWAATLLGRLGSDAAGAAPALKLLATTSPHDAVRRRAIHALKQIGTPLS